MIVINFVSLILFFFCAKAQAETCVVGVDGCLWTCKSNTLPGQVTCRAIPVTPKSCKIGSSASICGTTCTCSKAKTCKVGVEGCSWDCKRDTLKPGQATCLALPVKPDTCVPGSSVTTCGTTCTCSQKKKCRVGVKGCKWSCTTLTPSPDMMQCLAYPSLSSECYPGDTSSMCGTTCTCTIGCDAS